MNSGKLITLQHTNQNYTSATVSEEINASKDISKQISIRNLLFVQKKSSVGTADDPLEDEADVLADIAMRMPEQNFIQRKCVHCEEEEKVQRKPSASFIQRKESSTGTIASAAITNQINESKGGGTNMDSNTQSFMQSRFGADFIDVKIHTGDEAIQMNRELNAKAFTLGNDIYFNEGQYNPGSNEGKHLLAHELTHTLQQGNGVKRQIQRLGPPFGPAASGPSDWATQVSGATTSAQKAALIRTVVGRSVTVNDATSASASDAVPDPNHLSPFSIATPIINFDQALASKNARVGGRALTVNAGYTFQNGSTYYVVIGDSVLDGTNYNQTIQTINHEFDHINQYLRGSSLTGNESELDAWISTFIREFHHTYQFRATTNGTTCYVELAAIFAPLLMYYQLVSNATQHTNAVTRISTYYTNIIQPHTANTHAFRYWVFRSMRSANNPDLGTDVNTNLSLGISTSSTTNFRSIPCASVPATSLPGSSTLAMPTAPAARSKTTTPLP